jgi:hypothetical protein
VKGSYKVFYLRDTGEKASLGTIALLQNATDDLKKENV